MIINPYLFAPSIDPDAQAFITAAAITDPTQQSAINTLVTDLKGYNIWSKFDAIFPMVGGNATAHSYNLKSTSNFQLTFNGGWTHSSTGAKPNGTNAFANTGYNVNTYALLNSHHISYYSRTNSNNAEVEIGCQNSVVVYDFLEIRTSGTTYYSLNTKVSLDSVLDANSIGFYIANRTGASDQDLFKSGLKIKNGTTTTDSKPSVNLYIGAFNNNGTASNYSIKECAFSTIGQGLTDTEAANFYTAVQAFQTTLGRSIGTQSVSDADAQAFVTNAGIVDQVEANAVNNLVIGLKADGLWSKMKALYPMVGGTSSTMKYNLKNPLDTDAAFRLVFNGGLTYSSTGLLGGVNGYADTKLAPLTSLSLDNTHISFYSRTDTSTTENVEMGINDNTNNSRLFIAPKFSGANSSYRAVNSAQAGAGASPNMQGFFIASRVNSTAMKLYRNASVLFNDSTTSGVLNSSNIFLLCYNSSGTPLYYTDRECAFASIGDGLDDTEATNLNTRVTTFQTALNRNV